MEFTKKEIIEKINSGDSDYFYRIYQEMYEYKNEVEEVYKVNYGDGNEYTICLFFKKLNLYVQLEGTYSSWDSPYWEAVYLAIPYEFKETRYKQTTLDYIRDKNINEVLGEDEDNI